MPDQPMTVHRAIETIKILRPYLKDIKAQEGPGAVRGIRIIKTIMEKMVATNSNDLLRIVCLLEDKNPDEAFELVQGLAPMEFFSLLGEGFTVNPLADLVQFGQALGVLEEGWNNG
jgi:hypothetical protein